MIKQCKKCLQYKNMRNTDVFCEKCRIEKIESELKQIRIGVKQNGKKQI